jgi:peptidoglycan/LPS O-acetylase OafA/YrhL
MVLKYLEGINGLRFVAALLVVVRHWYLTTVKLGLCPPISSTVIVDRGAAAVDFFFTLSGFLITYLLIQESDRTGTISIKGFYVRRIYRIWPLYFIVLAIGFTFFAVIYPRLFHRTYFEFDPGQGLFLYAVFLPHWMRAYYRVGLLNPLWSIGVEEQFYLCWAPLMKWFGRRISYLVGAFIIITIGCHAVFRAGWFPMDSRLASFIGMLRFHYMAFGSMFACILFYAGKRYRESVFASIPFQLPTILVLAYHYIFGLPQGWGLWLDVLLGLLYGVLILNVSIVPNRLVNLEWEPLAYLGKISYGIYMYHMMVDYCLRPAFSGLGMAGGQSIVQSLLYGVLLLAGTIVVAHFSYQHIERHLLALGHRHSLAVRSAPITAATASNG